VDASEDICAFSTNVDWDNKIHFSVPTFYTNFEQFFNLLFQVGTSLQVYGQGALFCIDLVDMFRSAAVSNQENIPQNVV
jgi:hypothetical protein